jgi:hypothetical protein
VYGLAAARSRLYAGTASLTFGGSSMDQYGASFKIRQPDGKIAVGANTPIGNDVYNKTGAGQSVPATTAAGTSKTFAIKIQNDRFATDTFKASGPGSSTGFTVQYLSGATDVTSQVTAGTSRWRRWLRAPPGPCP